MACREDWSDIANGRDEEPDQRAEAYADGMRAGWAWCVAITGMAEAIRDAHAEPVRFSGRYFDDDFGPCD